MAKVKASLADVGSQQLVDDLRTALSAALGELMTAERKCYGDIKIEVTISKVHDYSKEAEAPNYTAASALSTHRDEDRTDDDHLKKWQAEVDSFEQQKAKLASDRRYENKFVAIKDSTVVDYDLDESALLERISKKFPDEVVLIVPISSPDRMVDMPSPEIRR